MFASLKRYGLFYLVLILLGFTIWVLHLSFKQSQHFLTFAMLDVGQGDALFIESPTGTQVLVDGGPPRKILGELSKVMSPLDRRIDAVIITNPDADHIGGFSDVLKNYKVDQVFEPGTFNDSHAYQNLETEIKNKNIPDNLLKKGMRLDLGGGVAIDILFPDRDVSTWTSNDGSLIARLSYGMTSILLTGDATKETENLVLKNDSKENIGSTILKVGHHGSHTSTGTEFLDAVHPAYALISDGKDNKYGHPHQETLDALRALGVAVYRTDLLGTIIMKSDGLKPTFSFHRGEN